MDFNIDENKGNPKVKTVYLLREDNTHALLTDKLTFIFLELNKFKKGIEDLDGDVLEGMYFCMKNMTRLDSRPQVLDHEVFKKMFAVSELLNMDEKTRSNVIENMTTERDLRNQMDYAKKEGIQEGRAEGRAEGINLVIRQMIAIGMTVQQVAEIVDMTAEEIEAIIAE